MKKLVSYTLTVLCLVSLITLTSCGETINKPINKSDVLKILERRYEKDFTYVSEDLDKDGTGKIIFEDEDGIQCQYNIIKIKNEDELFKVNYKYVFHESYAANYYSAHPEFFEPLNDGIHKCEVNQNNIYTMYYDSFEDIDEVVDFTFNIINNIECVVKEDFKSDIAYCPPHIYFACNSSKYDISSLVHYMPGSEKCNEYKHYQHISDAIKRDYVKAVKSHNDLEELSKLTNEQLFLYDPINVIEHITYNGEVVLDRMHFEENNGNRANKSRGYGYAAHFNFKSGDTGRASLEKLLKRIGWNVTAPEGSVVFTNGTDTLIFDEDNVTLNGESYEFDGLINYHSSYMQEKPCHYIVFTEKDFRDLFGIEFYFDQIKGTGEITKLGD